MCLEVGVIVGGSPESSIRARIWAYWLEDSLLAVPVLRAKPEGLVLVFFFLLCRLCQSDAIVSWSSLSSSYGPYKSP